MEVAILCWYFFACDGVIITYIFGEIRDAMGEERIGNIRLHLRK